MTHTSESVEAADMREMERFMSARREVGRWGIREHGNSEEVARSECAGIHKKKNICQSGTALQGAGMHA
eukprot:3884378-Rhodomonas_salina.4